MTKPTDFNLKLYQSKIILPTVWYHLSFRDLMKLIEERGLSLAHPKIMR